MAKRLTKAQLRQYSKDGFLAALPLFAYREIKPFRRALEHYEAMQGSIPRQQVLMRLSYFKPHLLFPWLDAICHHPGILDPVESILGPDILIYSSSVIIKNVGDGSYTPWHQPAAFAPFTGGAQVRVLVALSDSNEAGGCVRVIPGSHRERLAHETAPDDPKNLLFRRERIQGLIDDGKAARLLMQAGEMAVLDYQLANSSGPNQSNDRRIDYEITYVTPDSLPKDTGETATLARGTDSTGAWLHEPRPEASADPYAKPAKAAVAAHAAAMAVRWENFFEPDAPMLWVTDL
jgi:ectoine hydroxylase-related dioxygenase (phytanoyl-CoA dioxygenase family)